MERFPIERQHVTLESDAVVLDMYVSTDDMHVSFVGLFGLPIFPTFKGSRFLWGLQEAKVFGRHRGRLDFAG